MYDHHGSVVSIKPRVSVALAFRESAVCSGGNGLGYQECVKLFDLKKHSVVAVT